MTATQVPPGTVGPGDAVAVFDVLGPLPAGTTVLEASAGTGKTFTIAALAARYVAEGAATLPELLLVTFGRAATSELRDRVRERLSRTERALRGPDPRADPDPLVAHLAAVDDAELDRRRGRLARALAGFDAATIATTHGFCQQMLVALGVAADVEAGAALVPDLADLVEEAVDDVYLRRYADSPRPALTVAEARLVARAAVGDPHARLEPADAPAGTAGAERYALAAQVRAEVERRKRARGVLDYDDLLGLLRDALVDPVHGPHAQERVRARYRVVLVDEFQDTDPVQWQILRAAFHGHRTLVLIGDPKQAVYAFRGGDVVTYLQARGDAATTATLGRSWRSDAALLDGLGHVLRGAALGDPRILVHPVAASYPQRRHTGHGAPVRVRQVTRAAFGSGSSRQPPMVGRVRELVAADVAADVVTQLDRGRLSDGDGLRPVRPGDIAVLARRNADAMTVRDALAAAGVPAVVSGLSSVFASPAARAWLTLLAALEQPGHPGRTAAAALTPFVGWDAARLATADAADRDRLADRVRQWAHVLGAHGVAALLEVAAADGLAERLLHTSAGERMLTDLRHVAQTLHLAAVTEGLGVAALTDRLRRRVDEAAVDYAEERSRRLETDAAAVQVVTVHASKGLEFPVVYVPFAWDRFESDEPDVLSLHDDDGSRLVHVGGPGSPGYAQARDRHHTEERAETLRLLYVALTRARSQVVVWWAPSRISSAGPLTRLLLGARRPGEEPPVRVPLPRDDEVSATLDALAAGSGGTVAVERVEAPPPAARWASPPPDDATLTVGSARRRPDETWRRTSYTGLTAAAHAGGRAGLSGLTGLTSGPTGGPTGGAGGDRAASEPEPDGVDDEPAAPPAGAVLDDPDDLDAPDDPDAPHDPDDPGPAGAGGVVLPMAALPAGTAFGTLVHAVLERTDPTAADLPAELARQCAAAGADRVADVGSGPLAAALAAVLTTPLGPAAGGRTLRDVPPRDRLAELEFELPLAGGDRPGGAAATVARVADLLDAHLPAGDPFTGYAARLRDAPFAGTVLRGYLTGSLDAVLRVPGPGGPRHLVVDYKTNRLAPPGVPLTVRHYRPDALVAAMTEADYPLQLLLYLVALHRYLRWRLPRYDPGDHLGGGLYLFVRGMCGPDTPVLGAAPAGVLGWRPPAALVVALSALLDGGGR